MGMGLSPRLAGQFASYTTAQLNAFKAGQRTEAVSMPNVVKGMTDNDVQAVSAYLQGANSYLVGGSVSGLNGTVILQNDGTDNLVLTANGTFAFATGLDTTAKYAVTVLVQPAGQTCSVAAGSGTIASAAVTNVNVTCK